MLSKFGTFLLYNSLLLTCFLLAQSGERCKNKRYIKLSYFLLLAISVFRFDIGHDYENYANSIFRIANIFNGGYRLLDISTLVNIEPTMLITIGLFKNSIHVYALVIAVYSSIFTIFIYKTFDYFNIHKWGILLLFILTILFQSWDWMRQGVAMSIFLYSIRFLNQSNFKKYCCCIGFAAHKIFNFE